MATEAVLLLRTFYEQGNPNGQGSQNQNQDQLQSLDPYYVHPSESPTTVCVTPALNGENYHGWALKMRRALATKNKFKFVDGSIEVPREDDMNFAAWE
ncbi:hypothetical protein QL285_070298 [Trifolium repens]|nr:hypothetical protein QL285_070298 [Trifolium repens]